MKNLKLILFVALLVAMGHSVFSQQANYWYFGNQVGLHFNGGTPTALTNSTMFTNEGCATISDNAGNLLFYTDGVWIRNSAHSVINPTQPLRGHSSSTQSTIIIPKPGNPNRYYVFTQYQHGLPSVPCNYGLNYTEVNVSGGVTLVTGVINVNLQGCGVTTEKITAACHSNGVDYWAITVNQNGDFVSWPVTSTGVGIPVVSSAMATPCLPSSTNNYRDDRVGYMKVSRQGTHIVLGRRHNTSVNELFTFNNTTGQVTSNLGTYRTGTVYGVEFSSDGNYFYTTENFNRVVQYDVSTLTPTTLHTTASGNRVGALQLAPDGNIYVANGYENVINGEQNLDRITNINTYPATYNNNVITYPSGFTSQLGLPDLVPCFVPTVQCLLESSFTWMFDAENCGYQFTDLTTFGYGTQLVAWHWTFGDGTSSNEQNPLHRYETPGSYEVCLTVTGYDGEECCISTICMEVGAEESCEAGCSISHDFEVESDDCEPCTYNFNGFTNFSNRDIVAWIWNFGDGTTGLGKNASHTYQGSGVYMVCLTVIAHANVADGECCVYQVCNPVDVNCEEEFRGRNTDDPVNQTLPVESQGHAGKLSAYPNPANTSLHIDYAIPSEQKVSVQMMDYTGKIIWQETKSMAKGMAQRDIDISAVPAGIYLLVVDGETFNLIEKIQVVKY